MNFAAALDGDDGGVGGDGSRVVGCCDGSCFWGRDVSDGLAELDPEPGHPEVGEQALGHPFGGGLDQAELTLAQHGRDDFRHGGVVECVGEVVARRGRVHVSLHIYVDH